MKSIGIICEFNPFHNGHLYFINEIKKMYPDYILILVLNGYFLERGEVSILSKEDKTKISLKYGVDIVIELPFMYGTHSADIFSDASIKLLNYLKVDKLIFGSESYDIKKLEELSRYQLDNLEYDTKIKDNLDKGYSYPASAGLSNKENIYKPNDILGISYIRSILKNKFNIEYECIKRTNDFHDNNLNNTIVSASNIRLKLNNNEDIKKYIPNNVKNYINNIDKDLLFKLLKHKILTDHNLDDYVGVTEGIEYRLLKYINISNDYNHLVGLIKTKRYTYNKINRMLIHILLGLKKEDINTINFNYINILGFNKLGKKYLNNIKKDIEIPLSVNKSDIVYKYEIKASLLYDLLTNSNTFKYENLNKPIIK